MPPSAGMAPIRLLPGGFDVQLQDRGLRRPKGGDPESRVIETTPSLSLSLSKGAPRRSIGDLTGGTQRLAPLVPGPCPTGPHAPSSTTSTSVSGGSVTCEPPDAPP